jgi:hypothetical protein
VLRRTGTSARDPHSIKYNTDLNIVLAFTFGVRAPQSSERCKILYSRMSSRFQARAIAVSYEIRLNFQVQCIRKFATIEPPYEQLQSGKSDDDSRYYIYINLGMTESTALVNPISNSIPSSPKKPPCHPPLGI